jgi:deoxyribodipyrimidine photolyase-related protein
MVLPMSRNGTSVLRLMLADQLSQTVSCLDGINPDADTVLMCEVRQEATYVRHHKKKIAFLFCAMRHFANELRERGIAVRHVQLTDSLNTHSIDGEVKRAVAELKASSVVATEPGEFRLLQVMEAWQLTLGIPVEIRADKRFLADHAAFAAWAKGKKQLRMEFFYREMRKKHQILLERDGAPSGGDWNYDKENRKPPKRGMTSPKRLSHRKSGIERDVLALVQDQFADHFGVLEPFHYAVTRGQALQELDHFIAHLLPQFGDFQDVMVAGEPYLFHSLISSYLNAGLLLPLEICQKAEAAYRSGLAPINAVEGFIRQILGWREYIRGIYWLLMPDYGERNSLAARRPLPDFYWTADTQMFCIAEAVRHTRDHAYSHHIQRLMVTGNFALLAGLDVKQVQEWYLAVYSDAYEWVEMPNTLGMALYGDDGVVASKPYAASGKYIKRMSNSCASCVYDPDTVVGEKACPFNALYWDFLVRHEALFRGNSRMPYVFSTWDKFEPERQQAIRAQAALHLQKLGEGAL